jgi:hypothetical protein
VSKYVSYEDYALSEDAKYRIYGKLQSTLNDANSASIAIMILRCRYHHRWLRHRAMMVDDVMEL